MAYQPPKNPNDTWVTETIDASMHLTHNLDIADLGDGTGESILVGGREGVKVFSFKEGKWTNHSQVERIVKDHAVGEVRFQHLKDGKKALATVEPMHGNMVVAYEMIIFQLKTILEQLWTALWQKVTPWVGEISLEMEAIRSSVVGESQTKKVILASGFIYPKTDHLKSLPSIGLTKTGWPRKTCK
jgi:hypothetical protein